MGTHDVMLLIVATLTISGLMVGNEFAIAAFVNPTLSRAADDVHFAASTALARVLGRAMPFWYAATLVLTASVTIVDRTATGAWSPSLVLSSLLWAVAIVYTIALLVPINDRIGGWTDATRPADWKRHRERWDALHRLRVALLTVAFVALAAGSLARSLL